MVGFSPYLKESMVCNDEEEIKNKKYILVYYEVNNSSTVLVTLIKTIFMGVFE